MRPSSPELVQALSSGITARGIDVITIGLASTDGLYYASGALDLPGAMFTASHNPAPVPRTAGTVRPPMPFAASTTTLSGRASDRSTSPRRKPA